MGWAPASSPLSMSSAANRPEVAATPTRIRDTRTARMRRSLLDISNGKLIFGPFLAAPERRTVRYRLQDKNVKYFTHLSFASYFVTNGTCPTRRAELSMEMWRLHGGELAMARSDLFA